MGSEALKLLVIEDEASDFLLLERHLRQQGLTAECRRVVSEAELDDALRDPWDLVLSDYSVPGMDFRVTLQTIRARRPELPVILISGSVGEETAVELLRLGLADFILKDNLVRLVPSIRRTLGDKEQRRARRAAEESLQRAQAALFEEQRQARIAALNLMEDAVAARERAEAAQMALQESEAKYRLLAENSDDCIFWLGTEGGYRYISPACERLTGHGPEEFLADPDLMARIVHPDDRAAYRQHVADRRQPERGELEFRVVRKDGSVLCVLHHCRPIHGEDGSYLGRHGTYRNVTERKRAETEKESFEVQLRQAQKMESVGRLAGGVAHDFNNLLTVILGYAELLQMDGLLTEKQMENLSAIQEAGERAQALTQQLLMFSRKQIIQPKPIDWNQQLETSLKIYRRILGEDVQVSFRPGIGLPLIRADAQQLDQILANLLVNARDAIYACADADRASRITIETALVEAGGSGDGPQDLGAPGSYVCLSVRDTGVGMDQETLERIFEPFFTTKIAGKGTGLGLATVFGVVGQNKGTIRVDSAPGQGATFKIYWPALPEARQTGVPVGPERADALEGSETLLLVEDFDPLRKLCVAGLTKLGYRVVEAASAEQARGFLESGAPRPDLVVTDVVLPGTNGRQLAAELREIWPELPVLYISGYTADIVAERGILGEGVELLHKPFGPADLARRVRSLLPRG